MTTQADVSGGRRMKLSLNVMPLEMTFASFRGSLFLCHKAYRATFLNFPMSHGNMVWCPLSYATWQQCCGMFWDFWALSQCATEQTLYTQALMREGARSHNSCPCAFPCLWVISIRIVKVVLIQMVTAGPMYKLQYTLKTITLH